MLRPPRYAGTEQAGHGSVAVLQEHKLSSHQDSLVRVPSPEQAPQEPARCAGSIPGSPGPAQLLAVGRAAGCPCPGYLSPGFGRTLRGASCLYRAGYRVGAPGSAWLLPCGDPGWNRDHRGVKSSERLRRLGGVSCGDAPSVSPTSLNPCAQKTHWGNFPPVPGQPGPRRSCWRAGVGLSGRSRCRGAAPRPPHPLSLFCGPSPNPPFAPSFHTFSVQNAENEPAVQGSGVHQGFKKLLLGN